jgi:hypothetical protein
MKTLFRTFGFPLLALVAIIAVLAIRGLAQPTTTPAPTPCPDPHPQDLKIVLKIAGHGSNDYAELKDPTANELQDALNHLTPGALYKLRSDDGHGHIKDYCHTQGALDGPASIKTDKITTSEVAQRAQVQGSAANDPNLMNRITSNNPTDIITVLNTLKQP